MKTLVIAIALLGALPLAAAAQVSKEDIKKLAAAGVGDEVVLTFIKVNGPSPKLSADDIAELKKAGASDRVLQALVTPEPQPAPPRVVEKVVEREVYVPRTTYVSSAPVYSDYYYPANYSYAYAPSYYYGRPYYSSGWCYPSLSYRAYGSRYSYGVGIGFGYGWCR